MWTNRQKIIDICGQTEKKIIDICGQTDTKIIDICGQTDTKIIDKCGQTDTKNIDIDVGHESDNCLLVYRFYNNFGNPSLIIILACSFDASR